MGFTCDVLSAMPLGAHGPQAHDSINDISSWATTVPASASSASRRPFTAAISLLGSDSAPTRAAKGSLFEEARQEPGWPELLKKYYNDQVQAADQTMQKAAAAKAAAISAQAQAEDALKAADAQVTMNRQKDQALAAKSGDNPQELQDLVNRGIDVTNSRKVLLQKSQEAGDEIIRQKRLQTEANAASQAAKKQKEDALKGLQDLAQAQKRLLERRNEIPGQEAINADGKRITSEEGCKAETGTVFKDGKCIVAAREATKLTASELQVQSEIEQSKELFLQAQARTRAVYSRVDTIQAQLKDLAFQQKALQTHADPGQAQQVSDLNQKIAAAQRALDQAQGAIPLVEGQALAAGQAYSRKLQKLVRVQAYEEQKADQEIQIRNKAEAWADHRQQKLQENVVSLELQQASTLDKRAAALKKMASQYDGAVQDRVQEEAAAYKKWADQVRTQAAAAKEGTLTSYSTLEKARLEAADATRVRQLALASAGPRGWRDTFLPLSWDDEATSAELVQQDASLKSALEDYHQVAQQAVEALNKGTDALEMKTHLGLRKAGAERELYHILSKHVRAASVNEAACFLAATQSSPSLARRSERRDLAAFLFL